MSKFKLLLIVLLALMLIACSGRSVKSMLEPAENVGMTANDVVEKPLVSTDDQSDYNTQEPQSDGIIHDNALQSQPEPEASTTVQEEPPQQSVDSEPVQAVSETPADNPVVIIESENQYTEEEKAKLLKEIDALLDETLKDITDAEVDTGLDAIEGGGQ